MGMLERKEERREGGRAKRFIFFWGAGVEWLVIPRIAFMIVDSTEITCTTLWI